MLLSTPHHATALPVKGKDPKPKGFALTARVLNFSLVATFLSSLWALISSQFGLVGCLVGLVSLPFWLSGPSFSRGASGKESKRQKQPRPRGCVIPIAPIEVFALMSACGAAAPLHCTSGKIGKRIPIAPIEAFALMSACGAAAPLHCTSGKIGKRQKQPRPRGCVIPIAPIEAFALMWLLARASWS